MDTNKPNKYLYGWKLFVNYGNGPEYEYFAENKDMYREQKKIYETNCTYPQKWSRGRLLNPTWISVQKKNLKSLISMAETIIRQHGKHNALSRLIQITESDTALQSFSLKDVKNAIEIASE